MQGFKPLHEFQFWCQKVIPLVYDNSLSYYEVLCKAIDYLNESIANQNVLYQHMVIAETNITELQSQMQQVQETLQKFINGEYTDKYIDSLASWIDTNLQELVGRIVKYVFFGLTDDGYFIAYIPQNWDFISFDTIINPDDPLYGHLLLKW